jgi:lycopene beta-cyclase
LIDNHFDLIIIGGGCAGLSLSSQLSKYGNKTPKTLIIEQRENYINDRTWCFWDVDHPEYKILSKNSWSIFQIKNGNHISDYDCKKQQYLMLSSIDFYADTLNNIRMNQNFTILMNQEIKESPIKIEKTWHIKTKTNHFTSPLVVDTRPKRDISDRDSMLWQSFLGYEVQIDIAKFNPQKMVLMDIDLGFKNGLAFIYFLPTQSNQALIEYTIFSECFVPHQEIKSLLDDSISEYLKDIPYQILRTEHGILPMGNRIRNKQPDSSYLLSGLFAGAARPSSGYAFQRIQRWAKICARSIIEESKLSKFPRDPLVTYFMDGLFLKVIKNNPDIAASIFDDLFKNCELSSVVRFMSDKANFYDYLKIMNSLPALLFVKSIPSYLFDLVSSKFISLR